MGQECGEKIEQLEALFEQSFGTFSEKLQDILVEAFKSGHRNAEELTTEIIMEAVMPYASQIEKVAFDSLREQSAELLPVNL